jgi:hypothetical protein
MTKNFTALLYCRTSLLVVQKLQRDVTLETGLSMQIQTGYLVGTNMVSYGAWKGSLILASAKALIFSKYLPLL